MGAVMDSCTGARLSAVASVVARDNFPVPKAEAVKGHTVVEVVSATVPADTPLSVVFDAHPFVRLSLRDSMGRIKGKECATSVIRSSLSPIFRSLRDFFVDSEAEDSIHLEVCSYELYGTHEVLGSADVMVSDIPTDGSDFTVKYKVDTSLDELHSHTPADEKTAVSSGDPQRSHTVVLRRWTQPSCTVKRKTIYYIRHGESHWNKAQEDKDITGLMAFDHGINASGVQQAQALRTMWLAALATQDAASSTDSEQGFLRADAIFSSPLARALQTAMVCLRGHPTLTAGKKIQLLRSSREIKNLGSLDSVGVAVGDGIAARSLAGLAEVMGDDAASECECAVDAYNCHSDWWTPVQSLDLVGDLQARFEDFLSTMRSCPAEKIIVAGHSLFLRALAKNYMGDSFAAQHHAFAELLCTGKLQNGGCLALEVDFSQTVAKVVGVRLLFGSAVLDKQGKRHYDVDQP